MLTLNKSKNRRNELRAEFESDTGSDLNKREKQRILNYLTNCDFDDYDTEYENAMELLASIGVPFSSDGALIGIGWEMRQIVPERGSRDIPFVYF